MAKGSDGSPGQAVGPSARVIVRGDGGVPVGLPFRGDELFPVLEKHLIEQFPDIEIVGYEEFGNTHGPDELERIAGLSGFLADHHIDAVVSGMGC